jgi:sugar phosphate isomerase/epimerase
LLLAAGFFLPAAGNYKPKSRLAFSTLGCPDWDLKQAAAFAKLHGYGGIEVRGIRREMDLTKCPAFSTAQARKETVAMMKAHSLVFTGLGSSATLHFKDPTERQKQLDDGKRFIDLAAQIQCPFVRVFPNRFPKDQTVDETKDLISSGLVKLADYAKGTNVKVLLETHGDVVKTTDILQIMQQADHPQTGLIWDICNMWTITGEDPEGVYRQLKPYIVHVHVKDATMINNKLTHKLLGKGDVPLAKALGALKNGGYRGYYSFEWEKLWAPEIEEPEIAFADFPKAIKRYIPSI